MAERYSGSGADIQTAILTAHEAYKKANSGAATDTFITKVVTIGVESGGFLQTTMFVAEVEKGEHIPIKSS